MASAPRFSILLPTHNRADVLGMAIQSVLWQTERDFELLILGDGCTDATVTVVSSFTDSRIHWFDLPKAPGVGYANRNAGLRQARGRYIAYQQHDDIWFPDHLARLGARLDETGAELVHSRCLSVDHLHRMLPSAFDLAIPGHAAGLRHADMAIPLSSIAHTRACVGRHGGWDESMRKAGDVEFYFRIAGDTTRRNAAFVSEPTGLHFVASWIATPGVTARKRVAARMLRGLYEHHLPPVLQLAVESGESPQRAAWRRLSIETALQVAAIRDGVVQFQDALLWRGRTAPRLVGLRAGHAAGAVLDAIWRAALWTASSDRRRTLRAVRERTRAAGRRRGAGSGYAAPQR
jgi:Glycosyl transferase family 2